MITKEITINARVRTPDDQNVEKQMKVTIQRAELRGGPAGARRWLAEEGAREWLWPAVKLEVAPGARRALAELPPTALAEVLVAGAGKASHFQKAVLQIGDYLIYLSLCLVGILVVGAYGAAAWALSWWLARGARRSIDDFLVADRQVGACPAALPGGVPAAGGEPAASDPKAMASSAGPVSPVASSSPSKRSITAPVLTVSPGRTRTSVITPVTGDGISTAALSVSTSRTGWSLAMMSPGATITPTMSADSTFSPRLGSFNSSVMPLSSQF